jgi:hypothetical protein
VKDLIERMKENNPCEAMSRWITKTSKEDILKNCPEDWKVWAICKGITDFVDYLKYDNLSGYNIANLLSCQPQLIDKVDLDKLDGFCISYLLKYQPQLIDSFNLDKLHKNHISLLLRSQPQLIDKVNVNKLDRYYIILILSCQPQLKSYFVKKEK